MADPFSDAKERIREMDKHLHLSREEFAYLTKPVKINKTELKIGKEKLPAWRILYNNALGPGKGGIRFHPDVSQEEVMALSFWMTLKNSLLGLPYGGAKGGVKFNPKDKDDKYLQKVSRLYMDAFYKVVGADKDIPAPDVYTTPQIMGWMLDEYEKKVGHHEPGFITGKPHVLGGLNLRSDSTARGGFIILKELLHHFKGLKKRPTVAIQGFGNAGMNIAKMIYQDGFKVVAVSDSRGGIYDASGLNINSVIEIKNSHKSVTDSPGKKISNEELLELDADILILAALENQITAKNAGNVKAEVIIEVANGPVDRAADKILYKKGIQVVPDILANAGGVVVSYFEWAQNKAGNIFDEEFFEKKLYTMMEDAWHRVYELHLELKDADLRTAAYVLALRRVLEAAHLRGRV